MRHNIGVTCGRCQHHVWFLPDEKGSTNVTCPCGNTFLWPPPYGTPVSSPEASPIRASSWFAHIDTQLQRAKAGISGYRYQLGQLPWLWASVLSEEVSEIDEQLSELSEILDWASLYARGRDGYVQSQLRLEQRIVSLGQEVFDKIRDAVVNAKPTNAIFSSFPSFQDPRLSDTVREIAVKLEANDQQFVTRLLDFNKKVRAFQSGRLGRAWASRRKLSFVVLEELPL